MREPIIIILANWSVKISPMQTANFQLISFNGSEIINFCLLWWPPYDACCDNECRLSFIFYLEVTKLFSICSVIQQSNLLTVSLFPHSNSIAIYTCDFDSLRRRVSGVRKLIFMDINKLSWGDMYYVAGKSSPNFFLGSWADFFSLEKNYLPWRASWSNDRECARKL